MRVRLSDQDEIRVQEISNNTSERDEFGAIAQSKISSAAFATRLFKRRANRPARRTGHHCAGQDDKVKMVLLAKRPANAFTYGEHVTQGKAAPGFARSRNNNESHHRLAHGHFEVRRRL